MHRLVAWVLTSGLLLVPHVAHADWLFTPGFAVTSGRDTHGREHVMTAATFGWTDYDPPFGWEVDLAFAPDFFEGDDTGLEFDGESHAATLMLNGVIGDLAFVREATGWRPYVSAGIGLIQVRAITTDFAEGDLFERWVHEIGFDVGGGVTRFFSPRLGLRADVRYTSSFEDNDASWTKGRTNFDVAPGRFDFFRGTAGVTFRFD